MDTDKATPLVGEESKIHSYNKHLMGRTLKVPDFDDLAEEDDVHMDSSTYSSPMVCEIFAELFAEINSNKFEGAHFGSSVLEKGSMWITGLDGMSNQVLWQVNLPDFDVLLKKTIKGLDVYSPTTMVSFADRILLANKGDSKIYGFNVKTLDFERMFRDESFQIDAMCCNDEHLYIFRKKCPEVIDILDSKFQSVGKIPTGLKENVAKCKVDLCTATMTMNASMEEHSSLEFKTKHLHTCIISISYQYTLRREETWYWHSSGYRHSPGYRHPSVRAVNEAGVIWQVDSRSCPELDNSFNPCSVSTSSTGDVFISDNGTDRVSKLSDMGHLIVHNRIYHHRRRQ